MPEEAASSLSLTTRVTSASTDSSTAAANAASAAAAAVATKIKAGGAISKRPIHQFGAQFRMQALQTLKNERSTCIETCAHCLLARVFKHLRTEWGPSATHTISGSLHPVHKSLFK